MTQRVFCPRRLSQFAVCDARRFLSGGLRWAMVFVAIGLFVFAGSNAHAQSPPAGAFPPPPLNPGGGTVPQPGANEPQPRNLHERNAELKISPGVDGPTPGSDFRAPPPGGYRPVDVARQERWQPGVIGQPPQQPSQPAAPWGANPPGATLPPPSGSPSAAEHNPVNVFEPAQILARVGNHSILVGDLLGQVNQIIEENRGRVPDDELERQKPLIIKQLLPRAIETKIVYLDFVRQVPAEAVPRIERQLAEEFNQQELPKLLDSFRVDSPAELDAKLRQIGSSLDKQRRVYLEQVVSRQWIRQKIRINEEVTHEQLLAYYREHAAEYAIPAKVRWEQLMVRVSRHNSRADAYREIAEMGNELLRGAPFDAVARRRSHGTTAEQGGLHDWTSQGSLASAPLDEALFTLPPGKLSRIIEDENAFYIVRIVERSEATRKPFEETQIEIREKIQRRRAMDAMQAYIEKIKETTRVWTIFDEG